MKFMVRLVMVIFTVNLTVIMVFLTVKFIVIMVKSR